MSTDNFCMEHICIERLSPKHKELIKELESYEPDLVAFLREDALRNQENHKISSTFLWFEKDTNNLVGYITLLCDALSLAGSVKDFFRSKNVNYKALPAIKIGRVCVDDRYLRRGIGRLMVDFAVWKAKELNDKEGVGCRFITLDAKRNIDPFKDSRHFYKKIGFKVLREREKGSIPMYKDVYYLV